jgi:hypothetical protein
MNTNNSGSGTPAEAPKTRSAIEFLETFAQIGSEGKLDIGKHYQVRTAAAAAETLKKYGFSPELDRGEQGKVTELLTGVLPGSQGVLVENYVLTLALVKKQAATQSNQVRPNEEVRVFMSDAGI